jgi:hypothetical protein
VRELNMERACTLPRLVELERFRQVQAMERIDKQLTICDAFLVSVVARKLLIRGLLLPRGRYTLRCSVFDGKA